MPVELAKNIFQIQIPLENSPLKNLNAYLVRGRDRNLLVDTGYNAALCIRTMQSSLAELNVDMRETDLFLTHLHSDHCGMAGSIASEQSRVYMSAADNARLHRSYEPDYWQENEAVYLAYGFARGELEANRRDNPAIAFRQPEPLDHTAVKDGQLLDLGGRVLRCVETAGHTPGHMCLYDETEGILFAGDHIIHDITPNITAWNEMEDALGVYLESLRRVRSMDVRVALSAHRRPVGDCKGRIDALIAHHEARLADVMRIVQKTGGLTVYETASQMKWSIHARSWADFPVVQKYFAVGEAASHLDHLCALGMLEKSLEQGRRMYRTRQ